MRTGMFIEAAREAGLLVSLIYQTDAASPPPAQWADRDYEQLWPVHTTQEHSAPEGLGARLRTKFQQVLELLKGRPWGFSGAAVDEYARHFRVVIDSHPFDFVFCRYISTTQFVLPEHGPLHGRVIVDLDDIEPIKAARQLAQTERPFTYAYYRSWFNNYLLASFHKRLAALDQVLVCSEADRQHVLAKGWSGNVRVVPNGISVASDTCIDQYSQQAWSAKALLFCGNLSYGPNLDGLQWFLARAWPLILATHPDATLHIVGKTPDPLLFRHVDDKSVFLHADVPSVLPFYLNASVAIAPILAAGGTRIKILESFANRRPVVSTTIGAEGLDVVHGDHCLIADTPQLFATACCELLGNWQAAETMTLQAHRLVVAKYDSASIKAEIRQLFN
jgi:glycosyltransferase involved in cell wall biosynthesis